MSYEALFSRRADKALDRRLPQVVQDRVEAAVDALAGDPGPQGSRKMRGRQSAGEDRRLRVGDYRVEEPHPDYPEPEESAEEEVFEGLVTVLSVGHRQGIYG